MCLGALAGGLANLLLAAWQAGEERKTIEKRAFRVVCPHIFLNRAKTTNNNLTQLLIAV